MPVVNQPIFPQALFSPPTQFTSSTSTSVPTQILPAKTNGAIVEAILVTSTDTSARDINLYWNVGGTNYLFAMISIPATAGSVNSIPMVNLIAALSAGATLMKLPIDANGNPYLYLDANTALYAAPATALTAAKVWNITPVGGAY